MGKHLTNWHFVNRKIQYFLRRDRGMAIYQEQTSVCQTCRIVRLSQNDDEKQNPSFLSEQVIYLVNTL